MKIDNKKTDVLKAFQKYGFEPVRENPHIILRDGKGGVCSLPNHKKIKGSVIAKEIRRLGINSKEFWKQV